MNPLDDQVRALSGWARVALAARCAMRAAPLFQPGALRTADQARAELEALEACLELAALAAIHGKSLSHAIGDAAIAAILGAQGAPNRNPPAPEDHACRLAALAVQWAAIPLEAPQIDPGDEVSTQAALWDCQALREAGLAGGLPRPVPREFFDRPLWPRNPAGWNALLRQWQVTLAKHEALPFFSRYTRLAAGEGAGWSEAQARLERWASGRAPSHSPPGVHTASGAFSDLQPYAQAIAGLIDAIPADQPVAAAERLPFAIAVHGPAGSGKSVVARMVRQRLETKASAHGEYPHLGLWFNARRQEAQHLDAALAADVARLLDLYRPRWRRWMHPLPWTLLPAGQRRLRAALAAGVVVVLLAAGGGLWLADAQQRDPNVWPMLAMSGIFLAPEETRWTAGSAALLAVLALLSLSPQVMAPAARGIADLVRRPGAASARLAAAAQEFSAFVPESLPPGSRLVIFLDDLDRIEAPRALALLESLKRLFCIPQVILVVLAEAKALGEAHQRNLLHLRLDLPGRSDIPAGQAPEGKSSRAARERFRGETSRGWMALAGPFSRAWRGERTLWEVIRRSVMVYPPGWAPLVLTAWVIWAVPALLYMAAEELAWPRRWQAVFSASRHISETWRIARTALLVALFGAYGIILVQALNSVWLDRPLVILYPGGPRLSVWIFLPLQLAILAGVLVLGVVHGRILRAAERRVLREARAAVREKAASLLDVDLRFLLGALAGCTQVASGEELLIREYVETVALKNCDPELTTRLGVLMRLTC